MPAKVSRKSPVVNKGAKVQAKAHPSRMGRPKPKDVDEYLARLDAGQRKAFFKLNGKGLVSLGAAKTHCALYVMSTRFMAENKPLFAGYDVEGVTVRFPSDKPLPAAFVKALVRARAEETR
ncbi:MAG: DUF1801 domain-containing protein [Candidatus Thermoplasmatota archaeon]